MKFYLLAALLSVSTWTSVSSAYGPEPKRIELRCDGDLAPQCEDAIRWTLTRLHCGALSTVCKRGGDAFYCQSTVYHCSQPELTNRGDAICPKDMKNKADLNEYARGITLPFLIGGVFKKWASDLCVTY